MKDDFWLRDKRSIPSTPSIGQQMERSNQALRDSFVRNHIAPHRPAAPSSPSASPFQAEFGGPAGEHLQYSPSKPFSIFGRYDYNKAFNGPMAQITATPMQSSLPQPAVMKSFIGDSALNVRGPIQDSSPLPVGIENPYRGKYRGQGTGSEQHWMNDPIRMANENARSELNMIRARERQLVTDSTAAMRADANRPTTTREDDLRARHMAMRAAEGSGPNSALSYRWGQDTAYSDRSRQQPGAAPGIAPVVGGQPQPTGQRNFIQEALQEEQLREQRAAGQSNRAGAAISQATAQQGLEQQQRMSEIGKQLASATDPKQRETLSHTLLALMGKDPKDGTKALPISMPDSVDPNTGAVMKGGQAVVIITPDGKREIVRMDGAQQGGQADRFEVGKKYVDGQGRSKTYMGNGQWK